MYHRRIRSFVKDDEPWDAFTRALLTSSGSDFRDAEANFFRATARRTPEGMAEVAALTFLGEEYAELPEAKQKEYAKCFGRVRVKNTREWKEEIVYLDPSDPSGPTPAAFADYLLGPAREKFASAFVQRVDWWMLGLEKPLPEHVEIFKKNGFRLKPLVRAIALSKAYGRGSVTGGFPCRRIDAEVLDDMICDLTGAKRDFQSIAPEPFTFLPPERRSILIEDGSITSAFLLLFGEAAPLPVQLRQAVPADRAHHGQQGLPQPRDARHRARPLLAVPVASGVAVRGEDAPRALQRAAEGQREVAVPEGRRVVAPEHARIPVPALRRRKDVCEKRD